MKGFSTKIAILCDKNFLNYCSILGVLFTENIWVPLSIKTPDEISNIAKLGRDILIIDNSTSEELVQKISDSNIKIISVSSLFAQDPEISYQPKLTNKPEDLAMVYTSGSTGIPKGYGKNEGFVNTISIDIFKFKKSRFIDLHDLSFNLFINIVSLYFIKSHLLQLILILIFYFRKSYMKKSTFYLQCHQLSNGLSQKKIQMK